MESPREMLGENIIFLWVWMDGREGDEAASKRVIISKSFQIIVRFFSQPYTEVQKQSPIISHFPFHLSRES